ncbi:MAG: hypothetical protein RLZZ479_900 [Bacteroidota bacterium]
MKYDFYTIFDGDEINKEIEFSTSLDARLLIKSWGDDDVSVHYQANVKINKPNGKWWRSEGVFSGIMVYNSDEGLTNELQAFLEKIRIKEKEVEQLNVKLKEFISLCQEIGIPPEKYLHPQLIK